jgi:hypothetical protein
MKPGMKIPPRKLLANQRQLTEDGLHPLFLTHHLEHENMPSIQIGKGPSQRCDRNKKRTSTRSNITAHSHSFCAILDVAGQGAVSSNRNDTRAGRCLFRWSCLFLLSRRPLSTARSREDGGPRRELASIRHERRCGCMEWSFMRCDGDVHDRVVSVWVCCCCCSGGCVFGGWCS